MDWTVEPFVEYSSTNTSCPTPVEMGTSPDPTRTTARFTGLKDVCFVVGDAVGVDEEVPDCEEVDTADLVEETDDVLEAVEEGVRTPVLVTVDDKLNEEEPVGVFTEELVAEPVSLGRPPYVRVLVPENVKVGDTVGLQDGLPVVVGVREDDGEPVAEFALLPVEDKVENGVWLLDEVALLVLVGVTLLVAELLQAGQTGGYANGARVTPRNTETAGALAIGLDTFVTVSYEYKVVGEVTYTTNPQLSIRPAIEIICAPGSTRTDIPRVHTLPITSQRAKLATDVSLTSVIHKTVGETNTNPNG